MKHCNRKKRIIPWILVLFTVTFSACGKQPVKLTSTNTAMGTVVQYVVYTKDRKVAEEAVLDLQAKLERLEKEVLSRRIESSQVGVINAQAGSQAGVPVELELYEYLQEIQEIAIESDGALDVTLGEIITLWDLDSLAMSDSKVQQSLMLPEAEELEQALQNTGYEKVVLEEDRIYLPEGMSLDLGAVGKGIACDRISKELEVCKEIEGAVVSVGGSVVTYGTKWDKSPWNVAIVHPRKEGAYLGTLSVNGTCYISTSGDYERFIEQDGKRYHHIMNPDNGYPADSGLCSVTVVSDNGLLSDALSTACFVLGAEEGIKLVEHYGADALFVTMEQEFVMTDGMKKLFKENK